MIDKIYTKRDYNKALEIIEAYWYMRGYIDGKERK